MPKKLRDSISSSYIDAANRLKSKTARRRIVAYVESYDDILFWRSVLSRFENDKRYFEVMLPSHKRLERGKKAAVVINLDEQAATIAIPVTIDNGKYRDAVTKQQLQVKKGVLNATIEPMTAYILSK